MATDATNQRRIWMTALWLLAFFVVALFLRSYFSIDSSLDQKSQTYLFTGNDPYYEYRHLNHVVTTGHNLDMDPSINYPAGRGNPNPPLWIWTTAPFAAEVAAHTHVSDPIGATLNWSGAFWGAMIVFPVYLLGRDLFGRRAGLWAAFLMAVSAPHIQRTIFGFAKHDAATIFFITTAVAFLLRAFKVLQEREYVSDWRNGAAVKKGLRDAVTVNQASFLWAALSGVCLSAAALMWKGYDYALAILGLGLALQLIIDHLRKRDSTPTFLLYLVPMVLVAIIPYLAYYHDPLYTGFLATTIVPGLYVLAAAIVLGLVLVPTRQLPSVLVFPGLLAIGILGLVGLFFLRHGTYEIIVTGLGYFVQSKLYTTIAEAKRPAIGEVAANFAFFAFLFAIVGLFIAVWRAFKGRPAYVLFAAFAGTSLFLTFAASRFLMNSAPAFTVLAGWVIVGILGWAGLVGQTRRFGQNPTGWKRLASAKAAFVAAAVAILVVFPAVVEGLDASTSSDYEFDHHLVTRAGTSLGDHFFGAFGIGFELKSDGWLAAMQALAARDTCIHPATPDAVCTEKGDPGNFRAEENRPAFIAWWDYGHWAVQIGDHPTVADPFQDHYELAGRFLASESEQEGVDWLSILFMDYNRDAHQGHFEPAVASAIASVNASLPAAIEAIPTRSYDKENSTLALYLHGDDAFKLYDSLSAALHRRVGYMAADLRMYPASATEQGIFYAPVFLANKDPDNFLEVSYSSGSNGNGPSVTEKRYEMVNNNSVQRAAPAYFGADGKQWIYNPNDGRAYPPGTDTRQIVTGSPEQNQGIPVVGGQAPQLTLTDHFHNSMFAKAFPTYIAQSPSGQGLRHWRAVGQTTHVVNDAQQGNVSIRDVVLLEYYQGVEVSGKLQDDGGAALAGFEVTFRDGNGATHDSALTATDGSFHVIAPFAQDNDLTMVVTQAGQQVYTSNDTRYQYTVERAAGTVENPHGDTDSGVLVVLQRGSVLGHVFVDADHNGHFNANDTPLANAEVLVDGTHVVHTGASGDYGLSQLEPGSHTAEASSAGYQNATQSFSIKSGAPAQTVDLPLAVKPSTVNLTFLAADGKGVSALPLRIFGPQAGQNRTAFTQEGGSAIVTLLPGHYHVQANGNATVNGTSTFHAGAVDFDVAFGGHPMAVQLHEGQGTLIADPQPKTA